MSELPDWVEFIETYAEPLHPNFRRALSRQLYLQAEDATGLRNFIRYKLFLLVGHQPLDIRFEGKKAFVTLSLIVPPAWDIPFTISWQAQQDDLDIRTLHEQAIEEDAVSIVWEPGFPKAQLQMFIKPKKVSQLSLGEKRYQVFHYPLALPDIGIQLFSQNPMSPAMLVTANGFLRDFWADWNRRKPGRSIQFVSDLEAREGYYEIILDIGLNNNLRLINELLKKLLLALGQPAIEEIRLV